MMYSNKIMEEFYNPENYGVIKGASGVGKVVSDVGSEIILYVEKSEEDAGTVSVPNVIGSTYTEAEKKLTDAGFTVAFEGEQSGVVISQEPQYGVSVAKNSEVVITMGEPDKTDSQNTESNTNTPAT